MELSAFLILVPMRNQPLNEVFVQVSTLLRRVGVRPPQSFTHSTFCSSTPRGFICLNAKVWSLPYGDTAAGPFLQHFGRSRDPAHMVFEEHPGVPSNGNAAANVALTPNSRP